MEPKADVYVDDATLWTNVFQDIATLKKTMTQDLIEYQQMLNWTGGALTLHKYFYGIKEWEFRENGNPYLKNNPHTLDITMSPQDKREVKRIQSELKRNHYKINPIQQHHIHTLMGVTINTIEESQAFCAKENPKI